MDTTESFVSDFKLSVTKALRSQLIEHLDKLVPVPISEDHVSAVAKRGGIYELFLDGDLVYVGKSTKDLHGRLGQHRKKISGRVGGLLARVSFRCAYVSEDLDAVAPEKMLIAQLRTDWNNNGFGNKDPGKNRDRSLVKAMHFDRFYPIDLTVLIEVDVSGDRGDLLDQLGSLKKALPYNFRFPTKGDDAELLRAVAVPEEDRPPNVARAGDWLQWVAGILPNDWGMIALPGYIIAYPGLDIESHESRIGAWARTCSGVRYIEHQPRWEEGAVDLDEDAG